MNIIKIIGIAVFILTVLLLTRKFCSDYSGFILCFTNIGFTLFSVSVLFPVFDYIKGLCTNDSYGYLTSILFKSCGICILCSVASSLCKDAGEASLSNHVELCGKCTVTAMSLPLIKTVFDYAKIFLN